MSAAGVVAVRVQHHPSGETAKRTATYIAGIDSSGSRGGGWADRINSQGKVGTLVSSCRLKEDYNIEIGMGESPGK
jgi:hypothetical protein